jgi:drug/metabolite transporter (DMT)-like permease
MPRPKTIIPKAHLTAIFQAVLVTFLWSTSWVLIKVGLRASLPALTFAGLRYSIAFLCLLPFILLNPAHRKIIPAIPRQTWGQLILLGIIFYFLTQGAQFVSLASLPAATLTLLLNLSPILVALVSSLLGAEAPTIRQWFGILLSVAGVLVYFLPMVVPQGQVIGLLAALVGLLANSASSLLGRQVNARSGLSALIITTLSMGVGGLLLLLSGMVTEGFGSLGWQHWFIILWLAVVNTAIAFFLWNASLRILTAVESSLINNLMLPQIAILAWLFLDEPLKEGQVVGLILVVLGTLLVQLLHRPSKFSRQGDARQD